jgi:hypothetical protein
MDGLAVLCFLEIQRIAFSLHSSFLKPLERC